jgi:hypothetical protein
VGLTETLAEVNNLAPELGQHTEEVLMEILGYSWEQLAALRDAEAYWRKRWEREQGKSACGLFPAPSSEKGDRWLIKG